MSRMVRTFFTRRNRSESSDVHRELGKRYNEVVYKDALGYEFKRLEFRSRGRKNI